MNVARVGDSANQGRVMPDSWSRLILVLFGAVMQGLGTFFSAQLLYFHVKMSIYQILTGRFVTTFTWWGRQHDEMETMEMLERVLWRWMMARAERCQTATIQRQAVSSAMLSMIAQFHIETSERQARQEKWRFGDSYMMASVLRLTGAEFDVPYLEGFDLSGSTWPGTRQPHKRAAHGVQTHSLPVAAASPNSSNDESQRFFSIFGSNRLSAHAIGTGEESLLDP